MKDCCDTCGNIGVIEALVTCDKCLSSQEHMYCMRDNLLERPVQWFCRDCEPEKEATPPTCDTREDLATASTFKTSKLNNYTRQFANRGSFRQGLKRWERGVQTGRTQYIPVAEALKLPSGSIKPDQVFLNTFRSTPASPKTTGNVASPVKKVTSSKLSSDLKQTVNTSAQTRVEMAPKKASLTPSPSVGYGSKNKSGKVTSLVMNMPSSQLINDRKLATDTRVPSRVETPKNAFLTRSTSIGSGSKIKSDNYVFRSPKEKQPIDRLADVGRSNSAEAKVEQAMKKASQISNRLTDSAPRVEVALSPPSLSTLRATRTISGNSEARAPTENKIERLHARNRFVDVAEARTTETNLESVMKESLRPNTSIVGNSEARVPKEKQIAPGNRLAGVADARTTTTNVESVMKKDSLRPSPNTSTVGVPSNSEAQAPKEKQVERLHPVSRLVDVADARTTETSVEMYRGPAEEATWKGSFKMISDECNEGLCSGVQGCPPSVVLEKVYQMSKMMPDILEFELIARADPWKTIFPNRCPNFDDVGLFFFQSEKRCGNYFTWLEFVEKKDLVMRTCMHGVELLVFTSAHLHKVAGGSYFFWGLFRAEKVGRSLADNRNIPRPCSPNEVGNCPSEGDDSQVVDMEIDMEAGIPVGMVDIVMKRTSGRERSGAVGESTDVSSARLALLKVKHEPGGELYEQRASGPLLQAKSPRLSSPNNIISRSEAEASSPHIEARPIPTSSNQASNDIPPGFGDSQTLQTDLAVDIPPGFENMPTPRTSLETSKNRIFSTSPSSVSAGNLAMGSGKEADSSRSYLKIKSEVL